MNKAPRPAPAISLQRYFRQQAIRWAAIGFLLTTLCAIPCVLYSAKLASEQHLLVAAKSAARAFRPMILQENIRDAEFQMRKALDLKPNETAIIRDPSLGAVYPLQDSDKAPHCKHPGESCWGKSLDQLSLLFPIYFDEQNKKNLFGYLELTLQPTLDSTVVSILIFLLITAFLVQAFGLSSALRQSASKMIDQLSAWSEHLTKSPALQPSCSATVPYTELHSMQVAVEGLYLEIKKLREQTATEAKLDAQFALLSEVTHDLKTPHSQLARYFALCVDTVRTTGKINPTEKANVERILKRMGDLIRQACVLPFNLTLGFDGQIYGKKAITTCDLVTETKTILEDFRQDAEVLSKQFVIEQTRGDNSTIPTEISPTAYYRILENLLRNAIEAIEPATGKVTVNLTILEGRPSLTVKDNGTGINPEIHNKIFNFDFTTKLNRGTGLGLGIVNRLCTEFKASITFNSSLGTGTEFTVTFQPGNLQKQPKEELLVEVLQDVKI